MRRHFTSLLLLFCVLWLGCTQPAPQKKLVLFEFFGRQACSICKHAGPFANELLHEYEAAGQPVLMLGIDTGPFGEPHPDLGGRRARWREVFGDKMALLPLILVQSGNDLTQGSHADFRAKYAAMIEAAAQSEPTAEVTASFQRQGGAFSVEVRVTNLGTAPLDPKQGASIRVFFYDDQRTMQLDHTTRAVETIALPVVLTPHKSLSLQGRFSLPEALAGSLHVAAVLEYRDERGQWQIAQGALAKETNSDVVEGLLALMMPWVW